MVRSVVRGSNYGSQESKLMHGLRHVARSSSGRRHSHGSANERGDAPDDPGEVTRVGPRLPGLGGAATLCTGRSQL